jgi:hypothetical protein
MDEVERFSPVYNLRRQWIFSEEEMDLDDSFAT